MIKNKSANHTGVQIENNILLPFPPKGFKVFMKGSFKNYVDNILPPFDPLEWTIMALSSHKIRRAKN